MLASPTALKDYLFADSEAEYLMRHNAASDISRRELSAPAGARYLRKPDENEDRPHGAVGPRAFVMPLSNEFGSPLLREDPFQAPQHLDSKDLMLLMLLLWWMSLAPKTNEAPGKTI